MGGGARFSAPMGNRMMGGPAFRSMPAGGGFGFRRFGGGFDGRRFGFGGVGFGHHPRFRVFGGGCFGCGGRFARRSFFYPYYSYYPYYPYAYPGYYSPYDYSDYAQPSYASNPTVVVQTAPANSESSYENEQLVQEVRGLREDVRQLREEQNSRQQPRQTGPQPSASAEEPARTTVLVFRDGHRSEVQNYAIAGKTLWIFNERRANKVLLSDLNIPATRTANSERGVEFSLPQ